MDAKTKKWDKRFMEVCRLIGTWTSCVRPNRAVGAVITKNNRILATGYNGAPAGVKSCAEKGYCMREKLKVPRGERYELCRSVHAEQNAIISARRKDMIGSTLYLVGINYDDGKYVSGARPCALCKRMIINAGIKQVIVRDTTDAYTIIDVSEFIENDETLEGVLGY